MCLQGMIDFTSSASFSSLRLKKQPQYCDTFFASISEDAQLRRHVESFLVRQFLAWQSACIGKPNVKCIVLRVDIYFAMREKVKRAHVCLDGVRALLDVGRDCGVSVSYGMAPCTTARAFTRIDVVLSARVAAACALGRVRVYCKKTGRSSAARLPSAINGQCSFPPPTLSHARDTTDEFADQAAHAQASATSRLIQAVQWYAARFTRSLLRVSSNTVRLSVEVSLVQMSSRGAFCSGCSQDNFNVAKVQR